MKKLSIIVPMHKSQENVSSPAVKTWIQEIDMRCEVILSLDHVIEKDSLTEWCKKVIPNKPLIVHGTFGNPGETRNRGLEAASGEWVAFVDSDDYFNTTSALISVEKFGQGYDVIVCNYLVINENKDVVFKGTNPTNLANLFPELGFWRILYRRDFIRDIKFPPFRMGEDQLFFSRVLSIGPKISFSPYFIYRYVDGSREQISRADSSQNELLKSLKEMKIELSQSKEFIEFRKLLIFRQEIGQVFRQEKTSVSKISKVRGLLNFRVKESILVVRSFLNLIFWYFRRKATSK
jgi:glycosyltransferase involved in cell wall biosynthesis